MHVFHFTQWKNSTITRGLTCESEKQHSAEACWGHLVQSGSVQTGALVRKCETSMSCVQRKNKNQVSFYGKVNKTRQGSINCAKFVYYLSKSMNFLNIGLRLIFLNWRIRTITNHINLLQEQWLKAQPAQIGTLNQFNFNAVGERQWLPRQGSNLQPCAPSKLDLVLHLQMTLRDFAFLAFLAPWYSGQGVGSLRDIEAITFLCPGLHHTNNLC